MQYKIQYRIPGASVILEPRPSGPQSLWSSVLSTLALFSVLRGARQKFLGVDECPVQKKKFFVQGSSTLLHTPVPPDNFSVFVLVPKNEVAGVTI